MHVSGSTTRSIRLPNDASVFTAELYAIVLALIFIRSHASSRFLILTDSLNALLAFDPFTSHPIIRTIYPLCDLITHQGKLLAFCWVPTHVGLRGNECADSAAKNVVNRHALNHRFKPPIFTDAFCNLFSIGGDSNGTTAPLVSSALSNLVWVPGSAVSRKTALKN